MRRTITAFLLAQMNNGEFRSREPASASFVDASEELNTPTVIFAGKLIARVGLATNKPAELIILRISQAPHQPGHAGSRGRAGCGGSVTRSYPMTV